LTHTTGWKPSIVLEELGVPYEVRSINLSKSEQKEEWFLRVNPNGRIPALLDHTEGDLSVFESGAIMWYVATKDPEGKLLPKVMCCVLLLFASRHHAPSLNLPVV
jgi:glutathione S-transferase